MARPTGWLAAASLALAGTAYAHHAPHTFVRLDFRAHSVRVELMVPQTELSFAMSTAPSAATLPAYLVRHVAAATPDGEAWTVEIRGVRSITYFEQAYFVAELDMAPPAGGSARDFVFTHDAITHEVRNHVVVVIAERDTADVARARGPEFLGSLQYPVRQLAIRRPAIAPGRHPAPAPAALRSRAAG